ncbi:hypothetical protein BBK82_07300 [Lentzea guizhouensis]|uniref:Uncharacterized protein n=1 Tax=Lentzea guizhouensis TaxID=1586287 RepID=A0A1B2HDZ0_9PSEU|nr:hypothetical protein BBK82_07300 [Lentzea guizhouensis]
MVAFTFAGVLLTQATTWWMDQRKARRESAFRWTNRNIEFYADFVDACHELLELPVWPADTPLKPLTDKLRQKSVKIRFVAPPPVNETLDKTLRAVAELAAQIDSIRTTSKPGHGDRIDERLLPGYRGSAEALSAALDEFMAAARIDVDITSVFRGLPDTPA